MISSIAQIINRHPKTWLIVSFALIILPYVTHILTTCFRDARLVGPTCIISYGPGDATIMLLGIFSALLYYKLNKFKSASYYLALQIIGLWALLGFRGTPIIAVTYMLLWVLIVSYQSRGSRDLKTSPIYTALFLPMLFILYSGFEEAGGLIQTVFDVFFSYGGNMVLLALFGASTAGVLWCNFWTKRHHFLIYLFAPIALAYALVSIVVYLGVSNFDFL